MLLDPSEDDVITWGRRRNKEMLLIVFADTSHYVLFTSCYVGKLNLTLTQCHK